VEFLSGRQLQNVRQKITRITAINSGIKKKRRTPPLPKVLEASTFSSFLCAMKKEEIYRYKNSKRTLGTK
jgi:hypothetical protein